MNIPIIRLRDNGRRKAFCPLKKQKALSYGLTAIAEISISISAQMKLQKRPLHIMIMIGQADQRERTTALRTALLHYMFTIR